MTRLYIQPSWVDAASDHNEWSGGNDQYRGDRSSDLSTFDKNGRARVEAFSDDAINARKEARKSSISIQDRILPQQRRVNTLTQQMTELCAEYKAGNMSIQEYTMLLDILVSKRDRAIELLNKAKNVKPKRDEDEATQTQEEQEIVDLATENPLKQPQKKLENHVFFGACVIVAIVMLILTH